MSEPRSRRRLLKELGVLGAASAVLRGTRERAAIAPGAGVPQPSGPVAADGTIRPRTSTTDVWIPPRGRSFQKFSFDFPEPAVAFDGYEFSFRVFTHENV